jgi:hypothetical protein
VAFCIFVIVVVIAYAAYFTTNTAIDAAESQADINTTARSALERMTTDMQDIYLGQGGILEGAKQEISGSRADTLRFTSTAHVILTKNELPAGLAMIQYSVSRETGTGLLRLYRLDIPYRPGYLSKDYSDEKGYLLCDGLRSVQFTYWDQAGNEVDNWQVDQSEDLEKKKRHIPVMIDIVLRFANKGRYDLVFKTAVALTFNKDPSGTGR